METLFLICFLLFAYAFKESRGVWLILFGLYFINLITAELFGYKDMNSLHYISRVLFTGWAMYALHTIDSSMAKYQLVWLYVTLFIYGTLQWDLVNGYDLIFSNYEEACYGITVLQLLGFTHGVSIRLWCLTYNLRPTDILSRSVNTTANDENGRAKNDGGRSGTNGRRNRRRKRDGVA